MTLQSFTEIGQTKVIELDQLHPLSTPYPLGLFAKIKSTT